MSDILLEVNNLKKHFKVGPSFLHAVDDISFKIERGKTIGVVGESGCGKSTLGRCILRLIEPTSGEIIFDGNNIINYNTNKMRSMRQKMQIIFQDPFSSLDPRMSVGELIAEPLYLNKMFKERAEVNKKVMKYMELSGLANRLINSYPHELDGGRRQRIGIARALIMDPSFIVCDEPVSALDVSIQAQILNLMQDLQKEFMLTYLFITHDLSVVKHISDNIIVMYLGKIAEMAPTDALFDNPLHPYTQALLDAIPIPDYDARNKKISVLSGEVTSPINPKPGCRFASRCEKKCENCTSKDPLLVECHPNHFVSCFEYSENNRHL